MTISYFIPRYFKFHNQKQKTLNFLKLLILMCKNIECRIQHKKTVLLKIKKKVCILLNIFLIVIIIIFRSITK